ncbi:hypothetical protein AB0C12_11335 [Actinoplanes sp. NPDC048967]|uniref:hypothetical protein n=1 Tax=Actinoplanes sp. NPDC048967 TaxID=3155269 RepID=UPI00340034FE
MSVREQLFVRTDGSPAEVAEFVAKLIGGRTEVRDQQVWLLVDTARLVPGVEGEFGGPVVAHNSEAAFRPAGEFEAPDAYNVELRLWQAGGRRVEPTTGADIEERAATAVFQALAASAGLAVIHVHDDDVLLRAALPGAGAIEFPRGTTIYDWDEDKWNGFVLRTEPGDA